MEWVLLICGIALVCMAYLDILQTTLQHTGAGFLSKRIGAYLWRVFLKIAGNDGRSRLLNQAGFLIVSSLIINWIICIWFGYAFIYSFQVDSIVQADSLLPTDFMEKLYYVGYTFSTLGIGDLKAFTDFWRIITVLLSISGLLLITLSVTYLLPLLTAVTNKRKLCVYITFLGNSPENIILNAWNGNDLSKLNKHVDKFAWMILDLKEKHLLYPVLHYFHSTEKKFASPVSLTILDETVMVLKSSEILKNKIDPLRLKLLQDAISEYLEILEGTYIYSSEDVPKMPEFISLQKELDLDIENVKTYFKNNEKRRKLLHGMVEADGWKWADIKED